MTHSLRRSAYDQWLWSFGLRPIVERRAGVTASASNLKKPRKIDRCESCRLWAYDQRRTDAMACLRHSVSRGGKECPKSGHSPAPAEPKGHSHVNADADPRPGRGNDERRTPRHFRLLARHRVRMVRLLSLRHAGTVLRRAVLPARKRHRGAFVSVCDLCRRLPGATV